MPRPSLDEIFSEDDEFGLLDVRLRPRGVRSPQEEQDAATVAQVNAFFRQHGRVPDEDAPGHEEMRLGAMWEGLKARSAPGQFTDLDTEGLLSGEPAPTDGRSWRDDPLEEEVPGSLDDLFDSDDEEISDAFVQMKHVTAAEDRKTPDHRAMFYPCKEFAPFETLFAEVQARLDAGEREVSAIKANEVIDIQEGDFFIRRGLLAYVAEKTEMSLRAGARDHRLRVIFSNGTESDPLMSSFRKALADDPTARQVMREGLGPLDPVWEQDHLDLTGTIYVARSRSEEPQLREVRSILHKIGVTSQDVRRRVADARNDPTFLLAPVDVVATYDLKNLSRRKVENLLHRFFEAARPKDLHITDRFGRKVHPKEWFFVLPKHVEQAAELIKRGELHLYWYDPSVQRILRRR